MTNKRIASSGGIPTSHKRRAGASRAAKGVLAAGLAFGLVASGSTIAMADGSGGGGAGGGPGGTAGNFQTFSLMSDGFNPATNTPWQGYMGDSVNWFYNASGQPASSFSPNAREFMNQACGTALANAESRRSPGTPAGLSRVVGMYWASDRSQMWGYGLVNRDSLKALFDEWVSSGRPYVMNGISDASSYYAKIDSAFMEGYNSIAPYPQGEAAAICLALNDEEPSRGYDLTVNTDAASTFSLAGSTAPVSDRVHSTANGSSIRESIAANVTLRWQGVEGNPAHVTKPMTIVNEGSTASPQFTPGDFGWASWPSGKFWFDVNVPQSGQMLGATSHNGENDPRENWVAAPTPPRKVLTSGPARDVLGNDEVLASGQFYNAEITARTNGYASSMTIIDTIATDQVWIGANDRDVQSAVQLLDPNGNAVSGANIQIERTGGQVVVRGTVTNIPNAFQAREYTLVVPTYMRPTGENYTIADDSDVCYTRNMTNCIDGNNEQTRKVTPAPDKVWVIDEEGALVAADPNHTNQQGVDQRTFAPGSKISAVVNGSIPANLAENLSSYQIIDDWTDSARYVDFSDASLVKVFLDGRDVTSQFDVRVDGTTTVATAREGSAFLTNSKGRSTDGRVKLFISGEFKNDYNTDGEEERLSNSGSERWNNETVPTNTPPIFTVTPEPDKAWVLDTEGALVTADPNWSNNVGADEMIFLMNDEVSAVVNGKIPGNLGSALTNYSLTDDWSDAERYVDFSDASKARVYYETAVGSNRYADVTADFDIVVDGAVTTATAKEGSTFLANTIGLSGDRKTKLVVSGNFRDDFDTNGQVVRMVNKGSETWNNRTEPTNEPPVYTWTPDPNKQVLGSSEESGNNAYSDINGMSVFPGQKLEYSIGVDLRIPSGTARGVKSLAVQDVYDPMFIPDKSSVEFWDSRNPQNPRPVPRSAYTLVFDEEAHSFTATFTDEWIAANVGVDGANSEWLTQGWLTMRFTGTVSPEIADGSTVVNQAFQIINDARTATEVPVVEIPPIIPDKENLNTDLIDIDGKTVVEGDIIMYRLTLDASVPQDQLAYNVHKLGMVDDFDEEYLDLDPAAVRVANKATGEDVTEKFNVQIIDGIVYIFAKTIDTVNAYGVTIPGDPQPENLAEYDAAPIRPHEDAIIDQTLMGNEYWITLPTVVKKETDGYVIENQARQNIQNTHKQTKIVSNPLKDIDPDKDVVVSEETKDNSINEAEVALYSTFNYRLNSSEIPANRAYAASQWSMSDTFDRVHDSYTGIWAVYANYDIYNGDELVFTKGDLLQDSAGHESEPWNDLFAVTFNEETYTFEISATQKYLDLINTRMDLANSFSVYTKMERIAPSERIENVVTETYNNFDRESNIVWTHTPENPAIDVEKFTLSEGLEDGDRDDIRLAYEMTAEELALVEPEEGSDAEAIQKGVEVGFKVTNTGDVPLVNVQLVDATHEGLYGDVNNILCLLPQDRMPVVDVPGDGEIVPDEEAVDGEATDDRVWLAPSQIQTLAVGESVDCVGTLRDMEPGMVHGDTVIATGESVFTGTAVKDEDPWFAKAPSTPGLDIIKYTLDEGTEKGDRDAFSDALVLDEAQAKNGVHVGFDITNTGDEPLTDLVFSDVTHDATTGTVNDIKWYTAVTEEAPAPEGATVVEMNGASYVVRDVSELTDLAVGQTVTLVGVLQNVEPGTGHTDNATVEGTALYSGTKVSAEDPWNAKYPTPEVPDPKGAVAGDAMTEGGNPALLFGLGALLLAGAAGATVLIRRRGVVTVSETDTE